MEFREFGDDEKKKIDKGFHGRGLSNSGGIEFNLLLHKSLIPDVFFLFLGAFTSG